MNRVRNAWFSRGDNRIRQRQNMLGAQKRIPTRSTHPLVTTLKYLGFPVALLLLAAQLNAQWVAFNDHTPLAGTTAPHATCYNVFGTIYGTSGNLTNIADGSQLAATLTIVNSGAGGGATAGVPDAGTPLYDTFNGYVYFGTATAAEGYGAIQAGGSDLVTYTFSNLDPNKRYIFKGGAVRGNNYLNRWTLVDIQGVEGVTPNHQQGAASTWGLLQSITDFLSSLL